MGKATIPLQDPCGRALFVLSIAVLPEQNPSTIQNGLLLFVTTTYLHFNTLLLSRYSHKYAKHPVEANNNSLLLCAIARQIPASEACHWLIQHFARYPPAVPRDTLTFNVRERKSPYRFSIGSAFVQPETNANPLFIQLKDLVIRENAPALHATPFCVGRRLLNYFYQSYHASQSAVHPKRCTVHSSPACTIYSISN